MRPSETFQTAFGLLFFQVFFPTSPSLDFYVRSLD
jgi:hypothetical protein